MILQRDSRLRTEINRYGCYLMSIFYLVNKYTNYAFSPDKINELYEVLTHAGYMDYNCYIIDPKGIFHLLLLPVSYTGKYALPTQISTINEIEILRFVLYRPDKPRWIHFVVGNGEGCVTYDPYGTSRAVREGILQDKRIFILPQGYTA